MIRSDSSIDGTRRAEPTLRVSRSPDRERWSAFVQRHPWSSIFHTPEMHGVFEQTRGYRSAVWSALDDAGEIRALFTPVAIATLGGPLRALTTRVVAFANPLVAPEPDALRALNVLLRSYQRGPARSALFTEIRNVSGDGTPSAVLASRGFRHERHLNFLVDLTPDEETLWGRVASGARRNIQKARKTGVRVEEATDDAGIEAGYRILREVYKRIRVPLPDRSLFDAAQRILRPRGMFRLLLAVLDDGPIGAMSLLRYKDMVTYWYTGTLRAYTTHRAGDLLVWHAITSSRTDGCRTLDFGGAGRPDEPYGVRDFKAKYGGELVDPGRDVWVPHPFRLRVTTAGYELVRRFL